MNTNQRTMTTEPYVILEDGDTLNSFDDSSFIIENQINRQRKKLDFYELVFDFIKENNINGDYYEFGIHKIRTFRMALTAARKKNLNNMNFFAFDSFEGLPKIENTYDANWVEGGLKTSIEDFDKTIEEHGIYINNVKKVIGFYDDILTVQLKKKFLDEENKISFVNIDCDLYESAVPVFRFIEEQIQIGTVIYIDDFFVGNKGDLTRGVALAFNEFKARSRFTFVEFLNVGWWGKSYIVNP